MPDSKMLATDATFTLAKLLPVGPPQSQVFLSTRHTTGFPWQSVIRLVSPCTLGYSAATSFPITRQGCTAVNSKRDSLSCATQAHVSQFCTLSALPSNSPATIHPSLLLARPSAELAQHADSQLCSVLTVPSTLGRRTTANQLFFFVVLSVKSVNGFRKVRTVLDPMASLSALQADIFVGLPLAFALTLLATFFFGILSPCSCSCFASNPSRGDQITARVALLVTMLLQCVDLHRCCVRIICSTSHLGSS